MSASFPALVALYANFVGSGDTCFGIGAYVGSHTAALLALGARVIAVEPLWACDTGVNMPVADSARLITLPIGLADRCGHGQLWIADPPQWSSISPAFIRGNIITPNPGGKPKPCEVELSTLDELIDKFGVPSFCKMDVEGYEYEVLKGLSQQIPAISFEFSPWLPDVAAKSVERLLEFNPRYEFAFSPEDRYSLNTAWIGGPRIIDEVTRDNIWGDFYARLRID
jgi:FkbM family methyltransferase